MFSGKKIGPEKNNCPEKNVGLKKLSGKRFGSGKKCWSYFFGIGHLSGFNYGFMDQNQQYSFYPALSWGVVKLSF